MYCKMDSMFKKLSGLWLYNGLPYFLILLDKADSDLFCSMRGSDHCLHHVLPPLRAVHNLRVRGHPYNFPECSTNVHNKLLMCVLYMVSYNFYLLLVRHSVSTLDVFFCSSLALVFLFVILLLIAMSCHFPSWVRLSHSIKILTYLLR